MAKLYEYETEIGTFDVLFNSNDNFNQNLTCDILGFKTTTCNTFGKGFFASNFISYEGFVMALSMGHDFSTHEGMLKAVEDNDEIIEKYNQLVEKYDGDWDLMIADLKGEDPEKIKEEKKKQAAEEEKQAADSFKHTVKNKLDSLSDSISIEDGEEVISVIFGSEDKKEDGKKTDFWGGVFNEGILIATDRKVIYATRHTTSGSINADEFIYASIKGVQKKKSSGGFITVKIISVDDQLYGLRFSGDEEELSKAAQIFVSHVNKMIRGGGAPQVAPAGDDIPTQIKKLAELKDAGILSDEEFEDKKKELLAKM